MTKFGAKLYTAIIKNKAKRRLVYDILTNTTLADKIIKQGKELEQVLLNQQMLLSHKLEKALYYTQNYLAKPRLVVIFIVGGLGNQMYLYAFGRALQERGHSVIFDASWFLEGAKYVQNDEMGGGGR